MRYSPKQYAAALYGSLRETHGKDFSERTRSFLGVLKRNNALKLLPKILKEIERSERGSVLYISSTHKIPSKTVEELKTMLKTAHVEEKTAPEIFGGAVIEWADMRIDGSVRATLRKLRSKV